jgi:hypothetical protein
MVMGCNCLSAYSNPRSLICALRSVPDASNTLAAARLQSRALDPRCWRHGLARTRPIVSMRVFFVFSYPLTAERFHIRIRYTE